MKASEIKVGECCRLGSFGGSPARRIETDLDLNDDYAFFVTNDHKFVTVRLDEDVWPEFGFVAVGEAVLVEVRRVIDLANGQNKSFI